MVQHRFFHADRERRLTGGQILELNEQKLSRFGAAYYQAICTKPLVDLNEAEMREHLVDATRLGHPKFSTGRPSRMQVLFAALTVDDAIRFGRTIKPSPTEEFPIFEIWADRFDTLDMNWLDFNGTPDEKARHREQYWWGEISNHNPAVGERKPPQLEVLVSLPAKVGALVTWAAPISSD